MAKQLRNKIADINKHKLVEAQLIDIVGGLCAVKIGGKRGNGGVLKGIPFIGPPGLPGQKVYVDYSSGKPIVQIFGQAAEQVTERRTIRARPTNSEPASEGGSSTTLPVADHTHDAILLSGNSDAMWYEPTATGFLAAIADAISGDTITIPTMMAVVGAFTLPEGVSLFCDGTATLYCTMTLGGANSIDGIRFYRDAGAIPTLIVPSGILTTNYIRNCWFVSGSISTDAYPVQLGHGGTVTVEFWNCKFYASVSSTGNAYVFYSTVAHGSPAYAYTKIYYSYMSSITASGTALLWNTNCKLGTYGCSWLDGLDPSSNVFWIDGDRFSESITAFQDMLEPTGFIDRTTSTISFVDGTRTFTISPTGTNFSFYSGGTKFSKTAQTKIIANTAGLHYIYFDVSGTIQEGVSVWDINSANVPIACVYWTGTAGILYDERHGIQMDGQTQEYLHETRGSAFASGMAGTFAANGSTMTIGSGEWYDEDIEHVTSEQTTCRIFYLNSTTWNWTAAQAPYFHVVSSVPQYNNSGALANVDTAKYSVSWIYMTNATSTPVAVIMGQAQYNTQALAEAASLPNLASLPGPEMILLYRVIWQRNGAVITWDRTDDYRRVLSGPASGYIATDHGALAGLNDLDHPASAITLDTTNFDNNLSASDTTVQAALETLDELVAAGTADGISVSTTNFDNNLSAADDTVQKALETLDELVASGESGYYEPVTNGNAIAPELIFGDGDVIMAGPITP